MRDQHGMKIHPLCALFGHRWIAEWSPVGHIEGAEHRWCRRGCGTGQMRLVATDPD